MVSRQVLKSCWAVCVVVMAIVLVVLTFVDDFSLVEKVPGRWALFAVIAALAFMAEYVDSSLGMGYGTMLTPILMIVGFKPLDIVPAVLLSEFVSGISAGLLHHTVGNVDLGRGTPARRTMWIMAACSIVGTVAAVILAVNLPKRAVNLYIGLMILAVGVFIIFGRRVSGGLSWRKIVALGSIAAFNKGISGGGYGPLVTGGQVLAGVPEKSAVGITSMAEGLVCLVGLILYLVLQGALNWAVALPLALGALLSVPTATLTVKVLPARLLRSSIGYATLYLGALTLLKIVI